MYRGAVVQDVLAEPVWGGCAPPRDRRGQTSLYWTHVAPYGEVKLNMGKRLALRGDTSPSL